MRVNCRARRRRKALEGWEGSHSSPAVWEDSVAELGQSQLQEGSERMQRGSDSAGEALRGCRGDHTGCWALRQGAGTLRQGSGWFIPIPELTEVCGLV